MKGSLIAGAACLALLAGVAPAQTTVEIVATRDNTLYEDFPSRSNGAGVSMIAGAIARGSPRRALLAFDDLSAIPPDAAVREARLQLEMVMTQGSTAPIAVHEVFAGWGEADSVPASGPGQGGEADAGDATWLHREFDQLLWETPGGDFDPSPVATTMVDREGPYEWSGAALADLVEDWVRGRAENHGVILVGDEGSFQTTKHFSTREGTAPPRLVVTFEPGNATEAFPINQGMAGGWFQPSTPGQGFLIDVEPEAGFLFIAWFTFEAAGGAKVGSADQRWLTAQGFYAGDGAEIAGDGSVALPITNTTGGAFDDPRAVEPGQTVGTLLVRFDSCTEGEISYLLDAENLAGTILIQRLLPGSEALCEALAEMR